MTKKIKTVTKVTKKEKIKIVKDEFKAKVAELKKSKTKEELLEIVSIQPFNRELNDFMAARKALDELGVSYPGGFKISCEERIEKGE